MTYWQNVYVTHPLAQTWLDNPETDYIFVVIAIDRLTRSNYDSWTFTLKIKEIVSLGFKSGNENHSNNLPNAQCTRQ